MNKLFHKTENGNYFRPALLFILCISLFSLLIISCSLDRDNLLDPAGNPEINYPPTVDSLWVLSSNYDLTWLKPRKVINDSILLADGYYVYGAKEYNSKFDRLATQTSSNDTIFNVEDLYDYRWFQVSSYLIYFFEGEADTLEGYRSVATQRIY